ANRSKSRMAPSTYRRGPFYGIKIVQLVASFVAFGITAYFVSMLRGSYMSVPWIFIVHLIVFAISTISLAIAISVYSRATPTPKISIIFNGVLLAFWALSFGPLTHSLRPTLTTTCSAETWNNSTGIMVCRLYKILFTFEIIALASTLLGLALDFYTISAALSSSAYIRTENPK
ncbi:hypothetical protein OIDMADRAFT_80037, partial [Oidiodendron maius Zn]